MSAHRVKAPNIRTNLFGRKHNTAVSPQLCGENRSAAIHCEIVVCACRQSKHIDFVRKYGERTQNHTVYPIAVTAMAVNGRRAAAQADSSDEEFHGGTDYGCSDSSILSRYWLTPKVGKIDLRVLPPNLSIALTDVTNAASIGEKVKMCTYNKYHIHTDMYEKVQRKL